MEQNEYSVELLPAALDDFTQIVSLFIMMNSKNGAVRIKAKLIKAIKNIGAMPYSYPHVHDEKMLKFGFRMAVVEKYLVFFKIFEDDKKVIIYRILNGKTNYPTVLLSE